MAQEFLVRFRDSKRGKRNKDTTKFFTEYEEFSATMQLDHAVFSLPAVLLTTLAAVRRRRLMERSRLNEKPISVISIALLLLLLLVGTLPPSPTRSTTKRLICSETESAAAAVSPLSLYKTIDLQARTLSRVANTRNKIYYMRYERWRQGEPRGCVEISGGLFSTAPLLCWVGGVTPGLKLPQASQNIHNKASKHGALSLVFGVSPKEV